MTARKKSNSLPVIDSFDFPDGRVLAGKYVVTGKLGEGWEGEVYKVRERSTGIERALKIFFPHRNVKDRTFSFYARKLHKLRDCPILIQYHTEETITVRKVPVKCLISEYVEGVPLGAFLEEQPGKRISVFQGVHLLYALAKGIERIHFKREYHGDLHADNVIVCRHGLSFDLKLLDLFQWNAPRREAMEDDICDMIKLFYDAIGGRRFYAKQPAEVKEICCGLKRSLILQKFRSVSQLRQHLESMRWS